MGSQLNLFDVTYFGATPKEKRFHNDITLYKKVYSVFQYDQQRYMSIWRNIRELAIAIKRSDLVFKISPYQVLNACYIREDGIKKHLGDSPHIYRLKTLHSDKGIFHKIYNSLRICPSGDTVEIDGLILYADGSQAEIKDTWQLPIRTRVSLHLQLLKNLRKGLEVKEAVEMAKNQVLKGL
jgi:hypothetical protein